ncbi:cell division protein FtsA [Spirochaeta thermophila DSM 6578]|uniref:Cell division protein FtsA n=1 Tax=Winmispira thermophila (strain ATCC 700085 / DSM 6578 / Z-1203) TaxID=869211 RepID=G0GCB2_WINT7|nr:cell division protein FtsA [Spirochaeta thermophila]AEJ61197.1 cell division protein FtsA [Spirochaeta thermophila DSM 6578]
MDPVVVGLDIGTTQVRSLIAELSERGELEVTGVGRAVSPGLRRGVVINIDATLEAVREAIEHAEMMAGREVEDVFTGIAGTHIEGINSKGVVAVSPKGKERKVSQEDIVRVLDAAKALGLPMDREILHAIPQEYKVDEQDHIKDPLNILGVRLEADVHIITGSVTASQNLIKCVQRAGYDVHGLFLEALAAGKAVLTEDEKDLGVVHIDIGGGTTDVVVYLGGAPYLTGAIPIGASQVTSDLSIMLETPFEAAERLKRQSGCCFLPLVEDEEVIIPGVGGRPPLATSRAEVVHIIQARMTEIYELILEKIQKKGYLPHVGGGVVLTGGGALLEGASELAMEVFGKPARVGYPMGVKGLPPEFETPEFATAVGLLLFGKEVLLEEGVRPLSQRRSSWFSSIGQWLKNFFE